LNQLTEIDTSAQASSGYPLRSGSPGAATYFFGWYSFSAAANNGQITQMQDARTTFVENYAYDEGNRRVEKWNSSGSDDIYFYARGGKLLTVVQVNTLGSSPWMTLSTLSNRVYFGGMLLGSKRQTNRMLT
jgi:hypothetical protein